jgi:hypothetical protein
MNVFAWSLSTLVLIMPAAPPTDGERLAGYAAEIRLADSSLALSPQTLWVGRLTLDA